MKPSLKPKTSALLFFYPACRLVEKTCFFFLGGGQQKFNNHPKQPKFKQPIPTSPPKSPTGISTTGSCGSCSRDLRNSGTTGITWERAIAAPVPYLGVEPKIGGKSTPKWMVKIMVENPIKMDDLGVPLFLETPIFKPYQRFPLPETNTSSQNIGRCPKRKGSSSRHHFSGVNY